MDDGLSSPDVLRQLKGDGMKWQVMMLVVLMASAFVFGTMLSIGAAATVADKYKYVIARGAAATEKLAEAEAIKTAVLDKPVANSTMTLRDVWNKRKGAGP